MKKTYTENMTALWAELEPIVYAAGKDAPAFWRCPDGTYHYEVNPIPGDHIDKSVEQKALAADCPDEVIIQDVGPKGYHPRSHQLLQKTAEWLR